MFSRSYLHKKLVVVGDGYCGKTSLLMVFRNGIFPVEYVPTVFEADVIDMIVDGKKVVLGLFDTAGQEDYDRLRPLSYPNTDVALICFNLDDLDSLINVEEKWAPEIRHFCPGTPIVLIGTKKDLRDCQFSQVDEAEKYYDSDRKAAHRFTPVRTSEAKLMAQKIGASAYLECSAKLNEGVYEVFETAVKLSMGRKKKRRICIVL